ncbi:hypothetical protein GGX14DRAFT_565136 [Mycena pura]|uniref:Uncharacterized protein n=1 Tax=Mycena pura TaxID=153505 RepID=A0AAD6VMP5_9AGAR|nr:hypothetical protein GGX14DRAFT_565136 [Mycena pura]
MAHLKNEPQVSTSARPSSPPYDEVHEPPVNSSPVAHDDLVHFDSSVFDELDSLSSPEHMPHTQGHVLAAAPPRHSLPGIATIEDQQRRNPLAWPPPAFRSGLAALIYYDSESESSPQRPESLYNSPERPQSLYTSVTRPLPTVQTEAAAEVQQVGGGRDATPPKELQPTRLRTQIRHIESPGEKGERRARTSFIEHLKAGGVDEFEIPPIPPGFPTETPPDSPSVPTRAKTTGRRGRGHSFATQPPLYTSFVDYVEAGDFREVPLPPPPSNFRAEAPSNSPSVSSLAGKHDRDRVRVAALPTSHNVATATPPAIGGPAAVTTEETEATSATAPPPVPPPSVPPPLATSASAPPPAPPPSAPTDAAAVAEDDDTVFNGGLFDGDALDDEHDGPASKGKRGRPSTTQVRAVERLIQEVTEKIDDTVINTGLGRELIVRKLLHEVAGPTFNRTTIWHRFLKYAYHTDRRLDVVRLADPDFEAPRGEWLPSKDQVSASWSVFTGLHAREQQEEILSAFEEETVILAEETVRDRQRAFEKGYDMLTAGMRAQLRSEFDSFFIFTGPHINDDVQLAQLYTTPHAENFLHDIVGVEPRDFIGLFRLYTYCEELRPVLAAVRTNAGTALDLTQVFKSHTANIWEVGHIQALAKAGRNLRTPVATGITQSGSTSVPHVYPAADPVVNARALTLSFDKSTIPHRDAELAHKKAMEAHSAAFDTAAANGSILPPQLVAWLEVPTTRRAPLKFDYSGLSAEQKTKMKAENHAANRLTYDGEDRYYNNNIREALTEISRIDLRGKDIFHSIRSDNMTWTTLHQTLLDQKVRIVGFPSHMTIPTLAGSEKATNSWTMVDRAAMALALKARVLGSLAGLRLEYHPYDGVDDFAIVCHSYLRVPPKHDAGDEAFWRSSGGEALLTVTGSGLIYSSIYDLRTSCAPTSNAHMLYDNRPKRKQKLPLAVASSSKQQPDDYDDDDEGLSSVEEIREQVAEGKEEEPVVEVTKEKKGKARAAGGGKQKSKATEPNARRRPKAPTTKATGRQQKANEVEPEPLPARATRSRSRAPATSVSMPDPPAAPVQTGDGSIGGCGRTGDAPARPLPRLRKLAVAALPGEPSARNGTGSSIANCMPEDAMLEVPKKAVRFVTDVAPGKRGPEENVFQPPPNKRPRPSDESPATLIVPAALAVPDTTVTTAHAALTTPPAGAVSGTPGFSGTTLPLPSFAFPAASSTVNGLQPGTSGIMPAPSNPALPFAAAAVPTPTASDPTMWAMTAMMATLSEAQRAQFLQQMGFGTR